jgi:hypothetical protein
MSALCLAAAEQAFAWCVTCRELHYYQAPHAVNVVCCPRCGMPYLHVSRPSDEDFGDSHSIAVRAARHAGCRCVRCQPASVT